jgi:tRNA A-37 threonylcarbamoyl transferase component Bud32
MRERVWLAADARATLGAHADRGVPGWMALAAQGRTLSTDRDAAAARVDLPSGPLLVKWRHPSRKKGWKDALRPSRERTEARGLLAARAAGIDAPAPMLVIERRVGVRRLVGSVLVRPFVLGLTPADALLDDPGGERLLAPLVRHVRTWHDAGFRHGDGWPKNLLLSADGARAIPIGAPKARRVRAGAGVDALRLRDVARLVAYARLTWPEADAYALLDAYLAAPGLPGREVLERRLAPLVNRVLAKRSEDERTRPEREPDGPPLPVPLPPDREPVARQVRLLLFR